LEKRHDAVAHLEAAGAEGGRLLRCSSLTPFSFFRARNGGILARIWPKALAVATPVRRRTSAKDGMLNDCNSDTLSSFTAVHV
jgi:hypothetical protein